MLHCTYCTIYYGRAKNIAVSVKPTQLKYLTAKQIKQVVLSTRKGNFRTERDTRLK